MAEAAKPKKWIKGAVKHAGAFKAKSEAAGETTREFAADHAADEGKTGKQARLAETLMKMNKAKRQAHSGKHMIKKLYGPKYGSEEK
jgi:hypothetical protein